MTELSNPALVNNGRGAIAPRAAVAYAAATTAIAFGIFAPILYYMVLTWQHVDDYSHGFLVGPLAIYFAWERRADLRRVTVSQSWWGIVPLALGALALVIGRLGVELMAMRVAFVLTIIGLQLLLLGREVTRVLAFPLLFLFLMVPLPQSLVNIIAFPLQLVAADFAVQALHTFHIPALREGNIIHLANTQLFVAEACAGLRSLMALGTLAVVFAYFFRKNIVDRVIIVVSAIPIAIFVNAFRVALTGFLAHRFGASAAEGMLHTTEGFTTFALAFGLLLGEAWLLQAFWPDSWRHRPKRRQAAT
ncbi:MAG: exosortase/archaeosortase family protein [Myxococcota bacterium]